MKRKETINLTKEFKTFIKKGYVEFPCVCDECLANIIRYFAIEYVGEFDVEIHRLAEDELFYRLIISKFAFDQPTLS